MTTQTAWAAFMRAMAGAFVGFVGTLLTTYSTLPESLGRGQRWESAAIAAGIAACLALGWRAGVEGTYDSVRQAKNIVSDADVQDTSGTP